MEPRPSRPSRASGPSTTRSTRTPWTPSPPVETPSSQRTADIYGGPPGQPAGQWYGQQPTYAPEQPDYRQTGPITPIKPRGERGNKLLRYLLAALLLIGVIGGGAFAITRFLADDDSPSDPQVAAVTESDASPTAAPTEDAEGGAPDPTPTTPAEAPTATVAAPTATEPPTTEVGADQAAPTTAPVDASSGDAAVEGAAALLPDPADIDGNWNVTNEGTRDKAAVAEAIGPDGEALLTSWRWRENVFEELTRTDPESFPDETTFISVSIHRFANAEGAAEALTALSDIVVAAQGLQDVTTPQIGDQARGLSGPGDGVNLYVLYVQDGSYLLRLGGSSVTGDPAATIDALAEQIVASRGATA